MQNTAVDQVACIICNGMTGSNLLVGRGCLCSECEHEIVNIQMNDPRYPFLIEKIKEVFPEFDL